MPTFHIKKNPDKHPRSHKGSEIREIQFIRIYYIQKKYSYKRKHIRYNPQIYYTKTFFYRCRNRKQNARYAAEEQTRNEYVKLILSNEHLFK